MPHLSPLQWMSSPFIFWTLIIFFCSSLWWHQTFSFTALNSISPFKHSLNW